MVAPVKPSAIFSLALIAVVACSGKDTTGLGDAGSVTDARADAPTPADAGVDAPADAPTDTKPDAPACKLTSPYSTKNVVCNGCAEANCCVEINACFASKDCDEGYVNCFIGCALTEKEKPKIDACIAGCGKDYPAGEKLYTGLNACVEKACPVECGS